MWQNPDHAYPKSLVQVLLQDRGSFHGVQGFMSLVLGWLLYVLEEGAVAALVLHLQVTFSSLALLLNQLIDEVAHSLQSHIVAVETEAQREVGVGGQQMHADQVFDSVSHVGEIVLTNMGAQG